MNMHASVFIERADEISALAILAITHEGTESFSVTVRVGAGEVAIFADDAGQLLEFGRAIVRECETFPASAPDTPSAPAHAINDAVQHEEAMEEAERHRAREACIGANLPAGFVDDLKDQPF